MIRINLYPSFEAVSSTPVQQYAILGILLAAMGVGGWYWNVTSTRASLQVTVDQLQEESLRLQEITLQVQEFEERKRSLEERIAIIERLKSNQKGPVELMNVVIGSVPNNPPGLWLTSLVQQENLLTIEGRAFDVPFVADFIAALDNTRAFKYVDLQFWEQDQESSIKFQLHCETADEDESESE